MLSFDPLQNEVTSLLKVSHVIITELLDGTTRDFEMLKKLFTCQLF